jgi:hypothetical protein
MEPLMQIICVGWNILWLFKVFNKLEGETAASFYNLIAAMFRWNIWPVTRVTRTNTSVPAGRLLMRQRRCLDMNRTSLPLKKETII